MTDLLDVNVWVALAATEHVHHPRAREYWRSEASPELAFCAITMVGFLRALTHPQTLQGAPLAVGEAWNVYRAWSSDPAVVFESEPPRCQIQLGRFVAQESVRPRTWTDAYLAAFAVAGDYRLVTFDADMKRFAELRLLHLKPTK